MRVAKDQRIPIFVVGHVTKAGEVAGPKVLEHIVDTTLYMEGEHGQTFRLLRVNKNRFGKTDEARIPLWLENENHSAETSAVLIFLFHRHATGTNLWVPSICLNEP